ncbi:hypothetical protein [Mesorhizobium sp. WSM1293]|uniref:hypothetical protein n=1 Tax=Mesorhizobium sp. WSM1293 TaxID=1040984 RepID=UPI0004886571|nr:hypothetical protein [Mesorhizobium sp. WSM1293]
MLGDPWASYDAWKTTPPDWSMPYWLEADADELARMHRNYDLTPFFDGDESRYEWLCEERDELARIDAHERAPEDEDLEEVESKLITAIDGPGRYGLCFEAS